LCVRGEGGGGGEAQMYTASNRIIPNIFNNKC